jgi:antirestriction protein ArdC
MIGDFDARLFEQLTSARRNIELFDLLLKLNVNYRSTPTEPGESRGYYDHNNDILTITSSCDSSRSIIYTWCHELIHWTAKQLKRNIMFRSQTSTEYLVEELIAEFGSVLLLPHIQQPEPIIDLREAVIKRVDSYLTLYPELSNFISPALDEADRAVDQILGLYRLGVNYNAVLP